MCEVCVCVHDSTMAVISSLIPRLKTAVWVSDCPPTCSSRLQYRAVGWQTVDSSCTQHGSKVSLDSPPPMALCIPSRTRHCSCIAFAASTSSSRRVYRDTVCRRTSVISEKGTRGRKEKKIKGGGSKEEGRRKEGGKDRERGKR